MSGSIKTYTETVGPSKEGNLRRRADIWCKHFLPNFLDTIGHQDFNGVIIEIGAGMGHKLRIVERYLQNGQIIGIEPSDEMRREALRFGTELLPGRITQTGTESESVDVVHIPQVWHHIPKEDYVRAALEIKRILKPGGKVIVLDTFAPEDTASRVEKYGFAVANRAYAVLSQYPARSLTVRTLRAVHSILAPERYNPEQYGYFSPKISDLKRLFIDAGFTYIQENDHTYGISKMLVFQKGD